MIFAYKIETRNGKPCVPCGTGHVIQLDGRLNLHNLKACVPWESYAIVDTSSVAAKTARLVYNEGTDHNTAEVIDAVTDGGYR